MDKYKEDEIFWKYIELKMSGTYLNENIEEDLKKIKIIDNSLKF